MGHEIEIENGKARMAYVKRDERDVPWHGLGVPFTEAMTKEQAAEAAGFSIVEKVPVRYTYNGTDVEMDDRFVIVRQRDAKAVSDIVSADYEVFQYDECFALCDALVEDGLRYETVMSLKDGRVMAFMATLPDHMIVVGDNDEVKPYLGLLNSFDRSKSLTLALSTIRWVCQNTVTAGLASAKATWSMRHVENLKAKVNEAREALQLSFKYIDEFQAQANRMIEEQYTRDEFAKLAQQLYPVKDDSDRSDPNRPKQYALIGAFEQSEYIDDAWRHTKWGAYNAVTEYLDWMTGEKRSRKGDAEEAQTATLERRFWRTQFGTNGVLRQKAFDALTATN